MAFMHKSAFLSLFSKWRLKTEEAPLDEDKFTKYNKILPVLLALSRRSTSSLFTVYDVIFSLARLD